MDLSIFETNNGGDVALKGNDLELVNSIYNQPYLAMFGGNIEQSHQDADEFENSLERKDYWGNMLFFPDDPGQQFNSELERELENFALSSAGRQALEAVLKEDLQYLNEIGTVTSSITIIGVDKIKIDILIQEPEGIAERNFVFLWDGTRLEEIRNINQTPSGTPPAPSQQLTGEEGQFLTGEDGTPLFGES